MWPGRKRWTPRSDIVKPGLLLRGEQAADLLFHAFIDLAHSGVGLLQDCFQLRVVALHDLVHPAPLFLGQPKLQDRDWPHHRRRW